MLNEEVLKQQIQRMQRDPRMNGFSREFFGQWLRYRDYLTKDPILAGSFKEYDDQLSVPQSLKKPTRVATMLIRNDDIHPVTD